MKSLYILALICLFSVTIQAQEVPDFTLTDIDGVEHNLYSYLSDGKVVVLDASATWCSFCWSFHQGHYLQSINEKYGPEGTDQVVVIFYEVDANTTLDDLQGNTGSSQGNWLEGSDYAFVNESPITLSGSTFWANGYPTVNVINPDKEIIADLSNLQGSGIESMYDVIESAFPIVSTKTTEEVSIKVYPNPVVEFVTIDLSKTSIDVDAIEIYNTAGQLISVQHVQTSNVNIDMTNMTSGMYIVNCMSENAIVATKAITKK